MKMKSTGFTLIEILIFITILTVFFILAVSSVTVALQKMKFNENKIRANHFTRQLEDWLRSQKEINWNGSVYDSCCTLDGFTQQVTFMGNQTKYCFNETPIPVEWPATGECADNSLQSIFAREAEFTSQTDPVDGHVSQVDTVITTSWQEMGEEKSVKVNTVFKALEQ